MHEQSIKRNEQKKNDLMPAIMTIFSKTKVFLRSHHVDKLTEKMLKLDKSAIKIQKGTYTTHPCF